jgi:hypothetical protein
LIIIYDIERNGREVLGLLKLPKEIGEQIAGLLKAIEIVERPGAKFKIPPGAAIICAVHEKGGIGYYVCETVDDIRGIFDKKWQVLAWHSAACRIDRIVIAMTPEGPHISVVQEGTRAASGKMWVISDPSGIKKLGCDGGRSIIAFSDDKDANQLICDLALKGAVPFSICRDELDEMAKQSKREVLLNPSLEYFYSGRPEFFSEEAVKCN